MCNTKQMVDMTHNSYKLEPPDGGWGYIIMMSVSVYHAIISLPTISFGLIYGNFLGSIGDEISQTGLACGIYFTLHMFSGCITNYLLRKYSYRKVGLIGSIIYFLGAVGLVFMKNFSHLIICYGILEGIGAGFMIGAVYCSFNSYFNKRLNLMMSIVQITNAVGVMIVPSIADFLMKHLEFRNTLIALVGLSVLNIGNMATLVPVKRHMKKVYIEENKKHEDGISHQKRDCNYDDIEQAAILLETKNQKSEIIKLQVTNSSRVKNNNENTEKIPFIDIDLLKTLRFWNITLGCSLIFIADISFCLLIPVLLRTIGYVSSEIAYLMTISFSCDLASRIFYAIYCKFFQPRNRHVFFAGGALMAIIRTVFVLNNSYTWRLVTLIMIGFIRCLVASTYVLVIAEEYKETFPSAISLCMVNSGIVSLIYGWLGSFIKTSTGRDDMVVHLLTAGNLLCVLCWSTEFYYLRYKNKSNTKQEN